MINRQPNPARRKQSGYSLPGVLFAIGIVAAGTNAMMPRIGYMASTPAVNAGARHAAQVVDAAQRYIADHDAELRAATAGGTARISLQQLRAQHYLSAAVPDRNAFGQEYEIGVRLEGGRLTPLLVSTGGTPIREQELRRIAAMVPAGGVVLAENPGAAVGSQGGWNASLADYGLTSGGGHLAVALFYDQSGAAQDEVLHRNAHAGRPELNRMNTAIDMAGNDINRGGVVSATQLQARAPSGNTVGGWAMTDDQWLTSVNGKSVTTAGILRGSAVEGTTVTGSTVTGTRINGTNIYGSYIQGSTVYGTTVQGASVVSTGRLRADEYIAVGGVATAGVGCGQNGLLARAADGSLLMCQSSVWRSPSGGLATYNGTTCPAGTVPVAYHATYYRLDRAAGPTGYQTGWVTIAELLRLFNANPEYGQIERANLWTIDDPHAPTTAVKCG